MADKTREREGAVCAPPHEGGLVSAVTEGGAAATSGIREGDEILSVDGHGVHDVLDWLWYTAETPVTVRLRRAGRTIEVGLHRAHDQDMGVTFGAELFDGVRTCENACLFCFVSQLPPGLRPSLYVRDDDYRLSFLHGNFVTLTNLDDEDAARIREQRLSPLYVSLHASDADVRGSLICATAEDHALDRVDELLADGIRLHVQIVLVPGVNDGETLQRTLGWLADRDGIVSVGVVPLGFTAAQERFSRSYGAPEDAAAVIDSLELWREGMSRERGVRWVHAADEFYLAAGREAPPSDDYDGFPQFENGIGMLRAFIDEFEQAAAEADGRTEGGSARVPAQVVTGSMFAPVLTGLLPRLSSLGADVEVLAVPNRFLGGNVAVAGLLTGRDVADAIAASPAAGPFLVPDVLVNADGMLLDDVPANELAGRTGRDVRIVGSDGASLVAAAELIASGGR